MTASGPPIRASSRRSETSATIWGAILAATSSGLTAESAPNGHWKRRHADLLADCGITSQTAWHDYVKEVHAARAAARQPLTRWSAAHLLTAFDLAVRGRGWPAEHATDALVWVAADPATRSPARRRSWAVVGPAGGGHIGRSS